MCYLHGEDFLSKSIQALHLVDVHKLSFGWQDSTETKKHRRRKRLSANQVGGRFCPFDSKFQSGG